ncbi:hypothetical protein [Streptomyces iconiensis]|uniref:PsrA tetracyclin repressor-like C-terminal domain-containing protein n=1 Tax=Streptomyces iconiensis TaxID=1384038 RepID=A0ABT6ZQG2_9ACTN|nr:hypothetical protein [Streptomyces iconiensis]MDJ1131288.1 hypothetical protein [Streptomyces iconiensis]
MEAFAGPLFDEMPAGDEGCARTSRLVVTILSDPAEEVRSWTGPAEDAVRSRSGPVRSASATSRPYAPADRVQAQGSGAGLGRGAGVLPGCGAPRQHTSWSAVGNLSRLGRAGQNRTYGRGESA